MLVIQGVVFFLLWLVAFLYLYLFWFSFVLSGFVISVSHYNRAVCPSDFYRNRFSRIAPIYFIALIWACAYQPTGLTTSLVLSATFLQSWIPPYPLSLNSPGWSISVEAFFYAISPALLLLINKEKKRSWISWLASALLIWILTQSILSALLAPEFYKGFKTFSHDLINYFPASHLCSFLLGFSGGVAYSQNHLESKKNPGIQRSIFPDHVSHNRHCNTKSAINRAHTRVKNCLWK